MCKSYSDLSVTSRLGQRRRIWEMTGNWHCSIIGTCLSLADLRSLSRKLNLQINSDFPIDYQLHGFFAKEVSDQNKCAKLITKLLDKRHASSITKSRKFKTEVELLEYWESALESGDVPGPYWALLSHPHTTTALCERAFADIHMLSHLVGASNRSDIKRLNALEETHVKLQDRFERVGARYQARLGRRDSALVELRVKVSSLESAQGERNYKLNHANEQPFDTIEYKLKIDVLIQDLLTAQKLKDQQDQRINELNTLIGTLSAENQALEHHIKTPNCVDDGACSFDLEGKCLLYVGGRSSAVSRLRGLVETWNGDFLYHDGGVEKSIDELARAIGRADAVIFPTDCVSHEATLKVKKLCRQTLKTYVPLRSSGIGSFISALQSGIPELKNYDRNQTTG